MISKRLHDYIYLKENKYKKTKEMFKFIEKEAFPIKSSKKAEQVCDIGCASGNFLYYLSHRYKEKLFTGVEIRKDLLKNSIKVLNDREREILYSRRLNDNPTTLEDLSKKYQISRERVRQIENKAFEKLQKHMLLLAKSKNLLPVN